MGRRGKDEIERLEAEIKELKAVNRSLLRQIKKLDRGYKEPDVDKGKKKPREAPIDKDEAPARPCPDCHQGHIIEKIVLNRKWQECTLCPRRTKAKVQIS